MKHTSKRILSVLLCLMLVLSVLPVATFAATPDVLYFAPNSDWTRDGARFALWTWSGTGSGVWTQAIDSDGDGIYEADIPDGHDMVIFTRMSPNGSIDWNSKWNQSGDLKVPTDGKNLYVQKNNDWDCNGSWDYYEIPECYHENHDQTGYCPDCKETVGHSYVDHVCVCGLEEPMIAEPGYYLVGAFGGTEFWFVNETAADRMFAATEEEGILELVYTFAAGDLYKVVYFDGYGNINWPDGDNLIVGQDGELTMRYEVATGKSYFDGAAEPDDVSITVYCINSSNWAEVTAYAWNDGGAAMGWPGEPMTKTENTVNGFDVYEITLHTAYEKIIFNNNNNGYQTGDQILMAGQYFDVKDNFWYASLEEVPEVEDPGVTEPVAPSYYVAGNMNGWTNPDAAYIMNAEADGIYTLTFAVIAGDYELKVTDGTWANSWGKGGDNYTFKAYNDGEVTVTFNTADFSVNVTGECLTAPTPDCEHTTHDVDGICADCGETVAHSYVDGTCGICGKVFEMITIYFRNNWKWSNISIYYWGTELGDAMWPGKAMKLYANNGSDDIYVATVPADIDALIINGEKDDGTGLDQTPDIIEFSDGICFYMDWADGNIAKSEALEEALACKHNVIAVEAVDPTCYENGNIAYWYCDVCGQAWLDADCILNTNLKAVILPMAHGNIIHVEAVAATCYENGNVEYWYCPDCGQAWLDEACGLNTNLKSVVTPMAHGEIAHVEAVAATCYENGNVEYWYCPDCGQAWLDEACGLNTNLKAVILPMAHGEIAHVEAVAATCYENGNVEYWYCPDCGQAWLDEACGLNTNLKSVVTPMAHGEIAHVEAVAATCYENGNVEYWYCPDCGQAWLDEACGLNTNLKAVILPMAHGEIAHVEAVAATCYENGNVEYWYCPDCGQAWLDEACGLNTNLKSVVTPMAHGNIIAVEAVAATCYENGNIAYWYCADCGQAWLDEACTLNTNLKSVVVPAMEHNFVDGVCTNCGETNSGSEEPEEAPIKVNGLTCTDTTRTEITLTWDALDGALKYWIYVNGKLYTSAQGTTATIKGRKVNTTYDIYVVANLSDTEFLLAENADVITVTTDDYNYLSVVKYDENRISVTWDAEDCTKAWMYYGTSEDNMVLYASSTNGTFLKNNVKEASVYYVQVAYLIEGKIVYGEIQKVFQDNSEYIPL